MYCMKCNNHISRCTCGDIKQRLDNLKGHPNLSLNFCTKCGEHQTRCKCENPNIETSNNIHRESEN